MGTDADADGTQDHVLSTGFYVDAPPPPPPPTPGPPVRITNLKPSPATFYPLVRDGYRDSSTTTWRTSARTTTTVVTVRAVDGKRVSSAHLAGKRAGRFHYSWGGMDQRDGTRARPGAYVITVAATNAWGQVTKASTSVRVATKTITRKKAMSRSGNAGARRTRGSCYATRSGYFGTTTLDCWGGRFARATFTFRVPAKATKVRWSLSGHATGGDLCCQGRIMRTGVRTSPRVVKVTAQVTGWRAYEVRSATVTYRVSKQL